MPVAATFSLDSRKLLRSKSPCLVMEKNWKGIGGGSILMLNSRRLFPLLPVNCSVSGELSAS